MAGAGWVGGERWEMGTQKAAAGLGNDFGFSLNRLFSTLWRGGLFVADLTEVDGLCFGGRAHAGVICPRPVVLSLIRLDQKCSCCGDSITQKGLEGSGRKRWL